MRTNHQVSQFRSPADPQSATWQLSDLESELLWRFSGNLCKALGTVVGGLAASNCSSVVLPCKEWNNGKLLREGGIWTLLWCLLSLKLWRGVLILSSNVFKFREKEVPVEDSKEWLSLPLGSGRFWVAEWVCGGSRWTPIPKLWDVK